MWLKLLFCHNLHVNYTLLPKVLLSTLLLGERNLKKKMLPVGNESFPSAWSDSKNLGKCVVPQGA